MRTGYLKGEHLQNAVTTYESSIDLGCDEITAMSYAIETLPSPVDERPQIGSLHGTWRCTSLDCGVLTYAAEYCPGCGASNTLLDEFEFDVPVWDEPTDEEIRAAEKACLFEADYEDGEPIRAAIAAFLSVREAKHSGWHRVPSGWTIPAGTYYRRVVRSDYAYEAEAPAGGWTVSDESVYVRDTGVLIQPSPDKDLIFDLYENWDIDADKARDIIKAVRKHDNERKA